MNIKWLLALSAALNLVLLAAPIFNRSEPTAPASPVVADKTTVSSNFTGASMASLPSALEQKSDRPPDQTSNPAPTVLEVDDYPLFVKNLRAAGLSEATIATVVVGEIRDRSLEYSLDLQQRLARGEITAEEYYNQQRKVQVDQRAMLEGLLTTDGYRRYLINHDYQARQLTAAGNFTPEEITKYYDLRQAHHQAMQDLQDRLRSQELSQREHQDQLAVLQKNYQDGLATAVGPDAAAKIFAQLDVQMQDIRRQLSGVKLSEGEYVQLGRIHQSFQQAQQWLSSVQRSGNVSEQGATAQAQALIRQRKSQFAAVLGPERYAQFEKQSDQP